MSLRHLSCRSLFRLDRRSAGLAVGRCLKSSDIHSALEHCRELVRKHDYEHYLCTLMLPKEARPGVFAVRAFNVSLALVRDSVKEHSIGRVRLEFWRGTLNDIYRNVPQAQPVAQLLYWAVRRYGLTQRWLSQVVESRECSLTDKAFVSLSEAEQYSEQTCSSPLYLTLQCLGIQSVAADHAASHIGRAEGLITLLRSVPYNANQRRVLLPIELCAHHQVSQQQFIRRDTSQPVRDVIYDIAAQAHIHLEKARKMSDLPKASLPVFLAAVPGGQFLAHIQQLEFNPFHKKYLRRSPGLVFRLLWHRYRRTF